jgi:hypothetical protein
MFKDQTASKLILEKTSINVHKSKFLTRAQTLLNYREFILERSPTNIVGQYIEEVLNLYSKLDYS